MTVVRGPGRRAGGRRFGVAVAKALAPPPVALEWALTLVGGRWRRGSLAGPSADLGQLGRVAEQLGGGPPRNAPVWLSYARSRPLQQVSLAAPEWPGNVLSPDSECRGARAHLCRRKSEGRRRQDDDCGESRGVPREGRRAGAARRSRPAGERDLGARRARERLLELRPAGRRSAGESWREATRFENLDLIPSKPDLAGTAAELSLSAATESGISPRRWRLPSDAYDFVFIDCPPSLGPLTVNALAAASSVLVPVQAEYYALEGLSQLVTRSALIRTRLNPALALAGVVLTMVDGRTRLSADVAAELERHFGAASVPRAGSSLGADSRSAEPRRADHHLRPALRRRGCLLEGGDGACRAVPERGRAAVSSVETDRRLRSTRARPKRS